MKAQNLTESQKDQFVNFFYDHWEFPENDAESNFPWGCPWLNRHEIFLRGDDIEEMARNFYYSVRDDIWRDRQEELDCYDLEDQFEMLFN